LTQTKLFTFLTTYRNVFTITAFPICLSMSVIQNVHKQFKSLNRTRFPFTLVSG